MDCKETCSGSDCKVKRGFVCSACHEPKSKKVKTIQEIIPKPLS